MSRKPPIPLSSLDLERLETLIEATPDHVFPGKDALLGELGRANVLAPEQMPPDVVTMNSTVRVIEVACQPERAGEFHR
jgi:regulator of nucleoside diphosphate kinase